ncbi:DUF4335 domain-containing protein [Capilliphycus salinus ALCB114379]|uniref:DUF4335 domain-containing protein n=1 Tax=Capilliphycus salinus TaxID=2768948 RepID=UPI0039A4A15A
MTTRKYTPPTCTLEITTKKPRLGRAKPQGDTDGFQFKLSFDDPRLPEEEYVTVQGDRTQLESLSQTVISYVQDFLNNSAWFDTLPQDRDRSKPSPPEEDQIYLKPDGLLYHDLFLGALATQNTGPFVHLSALQLFDLLTALEDCKNAVEEVSEPSFSFQFKPLILVRTLLMILISIGALTGIIELINFYRQSPAETLSASPEETEPAPISPPNLNPSPALPVFPSPTPTPEASPPPVAANLPPVDTAPLPVPPPLFPAPGSPPPPQPMPNIPQQEGMMIILPEPQPAPPPQPVNPPVSQAVNPPPVPQAANPTPLPPGVNPTAVPPAPPPLATSTTPPPIPYSPPPMQIPPVIQLPPLQDAPQQEIVRVFPDEENQDNSSVNSEEINSEIPEDQTSENNYLGQLDKRPETIAATREEDTTLFDQIPQVDEVRTYFQEKWYPPKNLRKTLQYSLQLNADGTIASITPVGQPSVNRLPQLELPKVGEPFVSATADGRRPKIRIVLEPTGRVKAFLESFNNSPPPPPENSSQQVRKQSLQSPPHQSPVTSYQ